MTTSGAGTSRLRSLLALLVASTLLGACGGGTDGGDGGQFAGIEGTGIVSGFGSVYVDGIEFATNDAVIEFNGAPVNEDRLRVGDVVSVFGHTTDDGRSIADRIVFDRDVDGPITSISVASDGTGELVALGQRVRFDADTTFINTSAQALAVGDLIAISGFADDTGVLQATSIERGATYQPAVTRIDVEGTVQDLDSSTFRIGALTVRYDPAGVDNQSDALRNGSYVQVFGTQGAAPGAPLDADSVTTQSRVLGTDGKQLFVEGTVAAYNGADDFQVSGQRVNASSARRTDASQLELAPGMSVSVRGQRRGDVLIADTLELEPAPTVTLRARAAAIDGESNRAVVLGSDWQVPSDTLYLDRRDVDNDRQLRLARLQAGDTVQVNGYLSEDGLVMTRLDRVDDDPVGDALARGAIASLQRSGTTAVIDIAGVQVVTDDGQTRFENAAGDPISADAFYTEAGAGARVTATGPDNGGRIDIARTLRLLQ